MKQTMITRILNRAKPSRRTVDSFFSTVLNHTIWSRRQQRWRKPPSMAIDSQSFGITFGNNAAKVVNREKSYSQIAVSPKSDRMVAFTIQIKPVTRCRFQNKLKKKKAIEL